MKLSVGLKTDPGPRKGGNQDSLLSVIPSERPDMALLVVAVIQEYLLKRDLPAAENAAARLREAITAANVSIHHKGHAAPEMEGMGCTVVVVLVLGDVYWVASVGDSRAYLIRDGRFTQLTDDHTWVGQQVRDGVLTADQAARHSLRHVLERALGASQTIEIDVWPDDILERGDVLLLCTDGLYSVLDETVLAEVASAHPPQEAADLLLDRALAAPARDNVSVIILRAE